MGLTFGLEVINRYETNILNTAAQVSQGLTVCLEYVLRAAVKLLLRDSMFVLGYKSDSGCGFGFRVSVFSYRCVQIGWLKQGKFVNQMSLGL